MFASMRPMLARLSRWPRRIGALACLLLAVASALPPRGAPRLHHPATRTADLLFAGEVAVTVVVTSTPDGLHQGDRIGLLAGADADGGGSGTAGSSATASMLADRLRVLAPPIKDASGTDPPSVLVAARRGDALRIAAHSGQSIFVIIDQRP